MNGETVRRDLTCRLTYWRSLLRRHAAQGQQILRKLIEGRLLMTPHPNDTPAYYTFEGTGTLVGLLAGIVPHKVASLSVPSWNQVLGWLKEMDGLRKTIQLTA